MACLCLPTHGTQPVVFSWDNNDLQGGNTIRRSYNTLYIWDSPAESFSSVNGQQMPTFPVKRPRHRRSIQCTAVQELHYVAGSRGEHHYVADSDSLCLEAPSAGPLYLLLSRLRDCSLRLGRAAEGTLQAVSPLSAFNASFFQNIPAHQSQRSYICKTFRADTMLLLLIFHSATLYRQLASHSFFSDAVGDCAQSHDVVICGSHSIEQGTCDNYGGPGNLLQSTSNSLEASIQVPKCHAQDGCLPHSYRLLGGSWQAFW